MPISLSARVPAVFAAALPLAALTPAASAQFDQAFLDLGAQTESRIQLRPGGGLRDERNVNGNFVYRADVDNGIVFGAPLELSQNLSTGLTANATTASTAGSIDVFVDYTYARISLDLSGEALVGDPRDAAFVQAFFNTRMTLNVDADTFVEVTLRAVITGFPVETGSTNGDIGVTGLDSETSDDFISLDLDNPNNTLDRSIRFVAAIDQGAGFSLNMDGGFDFDSFQDNISRLDRFRLVAEARVVPAPAGTLGLAAVGLIASRRRR